MTTDLESRLRTVADKLDAAAERYTPQTSTAPTGPGVSRRTALVGAAVLSATAVAAGISVINWRKQTGRPATAPTEPPAPSQPTATTTALSEPTTATVTATTVPPPAGASTTVAGSVFEGWMDIAESPLTGREDAGAVWTGTEFLVWGGRVADFMFQQGAVYNPATDTWREITPNQWAGPGTATAWTGTQMVALFKNSGVLYDPSEDEWSDLRTGDTDQWFEDASWTGTKVLGIGGRSGRSAAAFVATATITPGDPTFRPGTISSIPWTTNLQFAATPTGYVVWRPTPAMTGAQAWAYDVTDDTWTELPALELGADRTIESSLVVSTATGWTVLLSAKSAPTAAERTPTFTMTATLDGTTWRTTELPIAIDAKQGIGIDGDRVIAFGPSNGTPMAVEIDSDGTLHDAWALDPQAVTGQALAWNGSELFTWGGRLDERDVTALGRLFTP